MPPHCAVAEVELLDAGGSVASPPGESLPPGTEGVLDGADFMLNPLGHGWHVVERRWSRAPFWARR